jgi:16S rRNA (adenine1518-N6/adenine1519-N6)-dimethyltransferase
MQSKSQIYELLLSAGVKPNKRFGQHFLIDLNLMRLLLDTAQLTKDDIVLEVGCATGSMTEGIAEKAGFCVAVEIDAVLANIARKQLADYQNVKLIAADALKNKFEINPVVLDALNHARANYKGRLLLIANLPYAAGTPLMLNLVTAPALVFDKKTRGQDAGVDAMFVTVQKEVADRMLAHQASKDYGILSILLCATGDLKHIRTLKPSVFWPQPQVHSAMISYVRNPEKVKGIKSIEMLSNIASAFLQHRRKMLKSGCKLLSFRSTGFQPVEKFNWPAIFDKCSIAPALRPDQLTPEQFVDLANSLQIIS